MTKQDRSRRTLQMLSLVAGLALPTLSLVPLGSYWLWQRGLLLYWAIAATLLVLLAYMIQRWMLPERVLEPAAVATQSEPDADFIGATALEAAAWTDVMALAKRTDPFDIGTQQQALDLAFRTIETVARRIHPEVREPLWHFTVPEAFAMLERVSRRLGTFAYDHVPLSDRLTVGQALALYRWRGTYEGFEKAYDIWRLVRMANPLTALTGEMRDRLSKQMLRWGREHVMRQLSEAYVKEVGRAAIDLYGGRLNVGTAQLAAHVSSATRGDLSVITQAQAEPLRILLVGQVGSGKSSLINALAGEVRAAVDALPVSAGFVPFLLTRADLPTALIIDSPGLTADAATLEAVVGRAMDCDLVLWATSANAADRNLDHRAMAALRARYAAAPNRRHPPLLLALTQIDRLRPFAEWSPPYDLSDMTRPKAQSIAACLAATCSELGISSSDVVPVSLAPGLSPYNVEALWQRIVEQLPEAQRSQLLRQLQDLKSDGRWSRLWSQTVNAGRVIGQALQG